MQTKVMICLLKGNGELFVLRLAQYSTRVSSICYICTASLICTHEFMTALNIALLLFFRRDIRTSSIQPTLMQ